jgi:hypothetical protein
VERQAGSAVTHLAKEDGAAVGRAQIRGQRPWSLRPLRTRPVLTLTGKAESYWVATTDEAVPDYPPLAGDLAVDVAIIGGGIVGLTVDGGRQVAVAEARKFGQQVTGRSTAKMTSQHGLIYQRLIKDFGEEAARLYTALPIRPASSGSPASSGIRRSTAASNAPQRTSTPDPTRSLPRSRARPRSPRGWACRRPSYVTRRSSSRPLLPSASTTRRSSTRSSTAWA